MSSVEVRSQVSLDELLNGVAKLSTPELEHFVTQVLTLRASRVAPHLPHQEARLLQIIAANLSTEVQRRYDELTGKRRAEMLTPEEHEELIELIDQIEQADAERTEALIALAQLRNIDVPTLRSTLGRSTPEYA